MTELSSRWLPVQSFRICGSNRQYFWKLGTEKFFICAAVSRGTRKRKQVSLLNETLNNFRVLVCRVKVTGCHVFESLPEGHEPVSAPLRNPCQKRQKQTADWKLKLESGLPYLSYTVVDSENAASKSEAAHAEFQLQFECGYLTTDVNHARGRWARLRDVCVTCGQCEQNTDCISFVDSILSSRNLWKLWLNYQIFLANVSCRKNRLKWF